MTVEAWLMSREPAPPAPLMKRMLEALGGDAARDDTEAHALCLDAATRILAPLLREERPGRESALDLLAADALVTYAFEAASASSDDIEATSAAAMLRLADLAGGDARQVARE
jgi:uncharacterized membrane protein